MLEMFKDIYGEKASFINSGEYLNRVKAQWLLRLRIAFVFIPLLILFFEGLSSFPKMIIFMMPYLTWLAYTYFENNRIVKDFWVTFSLSVDVLFFLVFCFLFIHQIRHLWLFIFIYSFLSASMLKTIHGFILYFLLNVVIFLFQKKYYYIFVNPGTIDPYLPYILNTVVYVLAKSLTQQIEYSNNILNGLRAKSLENDRLRALGSLMSGISHEFGTPINTLKIKVEKYRKGVDKVINMHDVEVISSCLDKLETTLKKINRSNLKENQKYLEVINVNDFFYNLFEVWSEDKENTSLNNIGQDDINIEINIINFTQMIFSLFDNAYESMSLNKKLELKFSVRVTSVSVEVILEDNGEGIDESIKDRVGDPFFTTKENGTGLGVYSSILFLNSCGGDISYRNTGHGTEVLMNLSLSMLKESGHE